MNAKAKTAHDENQDAARKLLAFVAGYVNTPRNGSDPDWGDVGDMAFTARALLDIAKTLHMGDRNGDCEEEAEQYIMDDLSISRITG